MGVPFVLLFLQKSPGLLRHILHILSMFKASNNPAIFVDEKLGELPFHLAFFVGVFHGRCALRLRGMYLERCIFSCHL